MKQPTYAEQWQKMTSAYVNNQVNPMDGCACFVGNLFNGNNSWEQGRSLAYKVTIFDDHRTGLLNCQSIPEDNKNLYDKSTSDISIESANMYSLEDICKLEQTFLREWAKGDDAEEALFQAFVKTLDLLKEIHIAKGEKVDEGFVLQKRLAPAN